MAINNLSLFLYAQVLGGFAYNLVYAAIGYHVLAVTGSPGKFAAVLSLGILPKVLQSVSGFLADQLDKKKLFVLMDIIYSVFAFSLLSFSLLYGYNFVVMAVAMTLLGVIRGLAIPITKSIVPAIATQEELMKANSYEISNDKLARYLSPPIALMILALFGFNVALFLTGVLYIVAATMKKLLTIDSGLVKGGSIKSLKEVFIKFKDGFAITFADVGISILLLNAIVTQILFHPFISLVIPVVFQRFKSEDISGILSILSFMGSKKMVFWQALTAWVQLGAVPGVVLSVIFLVRQHKKLDTKKGITWGIAGLSTLGLLLASLIGFYSFLDLNISGLVFANIIFVLLGGIAFFSNLFTVSFASYYQTKIPKESIGRFIGNFMMIFALAAAIGTQLYGYLSNVNVLQPVLVLAVGSIIKLLLHAIFIICDKHLEER